MQKLMKSKQESTNESSYVSQIESRVSRSESRVSTSDREHVTSNSVPSVSVNFVTCEGGKLAANTRKRLENQVRCFYFLLKLIRNETDELQVAKYSLNFAVR